LTAHCAQRPSLPHTGAPAPQSMFVKQATHDPLGAHSGLSASHCAFEVQRGWQR
jgi:hypothetical protein